MEEIDIMQLLKMFWKRKFLVIILVILGTVIGYVWNAYLTIPKYKATATFLLSNSESTENVAITTTDVTLNSKIINNYTELIKSDAILDEVIHTLQIVVNKEELKKNIAINVKKDTEFVELSVTWYDEENSMLIANKMIDVLNERVKNYYNIENLHIVDLAKKPTSPCNITPTKYAMIGAAIGFVLSCAVILIINLFDDTVKDENDVESKINLQVLATFRKQKDPNNVNWNPKSDYAESFKVLRTNLKFSGGTNDIQTIAISSIFPDEGKSWIVTNLAYAYANADYKVLIVDADLRKGVQHLKFDVPQKPGLTALIKHANKIKKDESYLNDYIKETSSKNIYVLPCGHNTTNSSELLLSNNVKKIIEKLKECFDIIIFDSTPGALVTDAVVLSRLVDTNLIVTEFERTKFRDLRKLRNSIENVGGKISGVVINKVNSKNKSYYYYYGNEKSMVDAKKRRYAKK